MATRYKILSEKDIPLTMAQGGSGQITQQAAIDALTDVSGATDEYVLTKDTSTGNAIFKVAAGGGLTTTAVKTSAYTAALNDLVLCDTDTTGAFTVTFPTAVGNSGKRIGVKLLTASSNNKLTIDGNGTQTLETKSETSQTIGMWIAGDIMIWESDGSNWFYVYDGLIPHRARLRRNAAQTIATGTFVQIDFDTSDYDVGGIGDIVTNDEVVIKRKGEYCISSTVSFFMANGKYCISSIFVNGAESIRSKDMAGAGDFIDAERTDTLSLAVGDTVDQRVYHNKGSNNNTGSFNQSDPMIAIFEVR